MEQQDKQTETEAEILTRAAKRVAGAILAKTDTTLDYDRGALDAIAELYHLARQARAAAMLRGES